MRRIRLIAVVALAAELFLACTSSRADEPPFVRKVDVVYGRKYGTALTMDVFTPTKAPNGAGVIMVISGGFHSSHEAIQPLLILPFVNRGYTVFAVVHGSQPEYTVPEIVKDMNRAVRFIRHHAKDYGIAPDRLGVTGASAGGHLSLMLGTAGAPGNSSANDPVDRESSRVQAVACFFPPTDLLNFGSPGHELIRAEDHGPPFRAAFQYREMEPQSRVWVPITDPKRLREIARDISPIYHVSPDDPPTLMIHGDADALVPLQQSEEMLKALEKAGVSAKLVVKPKAGHGWATMGRDVGTLADWFDTHLKGGAGRGEDARERLGDPTMKTRADRLAHAITAFVENPVTNLVKGVVLLGIGSEASRTFFEDLSQGRVRVGHGLVIIGLFGILDALPHFIEGLEASQRYLELRQESPIQA